MMMREITRLRVYSGGHRPEDAFTSTVRTRDMAASVESIRRVDPHAVIEVLEDGSPAVDDLHRMWCEIRTEDGR